MNSPVPLNFMGMSMHRRMWYLVLGAFASGIAFCVLGFTVGTLIMNWAGEDAVYREKMRNFEENLELLRRIRDSERERKEWRQTAQSMSKRLNKILQQYGETQCENSNVTSTGAWCGWPYQNAHHHDNGIAEVLSGMLKEKTVASFGEGRGTYKSVVTGTKRFDAFDGSPMVEKETKGAVKFLDLTVPQFQPQYDWVLCLEVAEHIPAEFEKILIQNLVRHAKEGLVISWAPKHQLGFEHVNPKSLDDVKWELGEHFELDNQLTRRLRMAAELPWLKKNLLVFIREESLNPEPEVKA